VKTTRASLLATIHPRYLLFSPISTFYLSKKKLAVQIPFGGTPTKKSENV